MTPRRKNRALLGEIPDRLGKPVRVTFLRSTGVIEFRPLRARRPERIRRVTVADVFEFANGQGLFRLVP